MKSITMPSPGNHDPYSSRYSAYFSMPANYSFDLGKWHLISLDSTNVPAAAAFLDADLTGRSNRCILAYWHHQRFSSGATHGNNSAIAPLWDRLYAAGADVFFNGHEHTYERFAPQTPAAEPSATANSEVRITRFGVLRMTLRPTAYEWSFQAEDGATYDSGSTACS